MIVPQTENRCGATWFLMLLAALPVTAWPSSGEVLFRELRQQVEVQRQKMPAEDLSAAGDTLGRTPANPGYNLIECTAEAIALLRANGSGFEKSREFIYNAIYSQVNIPFGGKYCLYLTEPINRSLTIDEARDITVAERIELPRYQPSANDLQIAEENFQTLRSKARAARATMTQNQRDEISALTDHIVECSDKEITDEGFWQEGTRGFGDIENIDSVNYVWNWGHSVDGDACVFVRSPMHRALTVDEAEDLFTVTRVPLPSMQYALPISDAGDMRKARGFNGAAPKDNDDKK